MGAWFSVAGIATFKAADDVRAVVAEMPADRIIVETDCPYLAPEGYRGKRNEPARVVRVLEELARVRGASVADLARATSASATELFALPAAGA